MKINLFFAVALTLAVFTSCSKESQQNKSVTGDETSVVLTIHRESDPGLSRAEGTNLGHGTSLVFTSGKLYFTDVAGNIIKVVDVITTGTPTESQVNLNSSGVKTIEKVPSTVRKVYIVGNSTGLPAAPGPNISTVQQMVVSLNSQNDAATGNAAKISLYGQDEAIVTTTDGTPYTAAVTVKPICARIEIDKFTYTGGNGITEYIIDGIFMNNYHQNIELGGSQIPLLSTDANLVTNGPEDNAQVPVIYVGGSTEYPTPDNGLYYDYAAAGLGVLTTVGTNLQYAPATASPAKIWAYNLLAPTTSYDVTPKASEIPRMVIRLSGFGAGDIVSGYRYMTVKGFKNASTGVEIDKFEPGKIYRIKNFTFDEDDLEVLPEMVPVTVEVTVTLQPWEELEVNPIH